MMGAEIAAAKKAEVPERLRQLGESQRLRDVRRAETEAIRHKAREPLAAGFPMVVCEGDPDWPTVLSWIYRVGAKREIAAPSRVMIVRQEGQGGWWVQATAVFDRGNGRRDLIDVFKDVISTERFYASWSPP